MYPAAAEGPGAMGGCSPWLQGPAGQPANVHVLLPCQVRGAGKILQGRLPVARKLGRQGVVSAVCPGRLLHILHHALNVGVGSFRSQFGWCRWGLHSQLGQAALHHHGRWGDLAMRVPTCCSQFPHCWFHRCQAPVPSGGCFLSLAEE
jgi:hypothetical protein